MDSSLKIRPRTAIIAVAVLTLLLVIWAWQRSAAEERRRQEEIATAEGVAQVLQATFAGQTDLRVAAVRGTIDVTSVNRGSIFKSTQKATLPFSVDYFVDLSGLNGDDARFDSRARTLSIEIPEVRIAEPNIDLTRGKLGTAEGWWVSRQAGANLINRSVRLSKAQAVKTAREPQHLQNARNEARERVQDLLEVPLRAAGYSDIKVQVRFQGEPGTGRDSSVLDQSRSYNEVLEEARQKAS